MKTLRFFGMMLMAVLMSFSMTACGDDDDDDSSEGGSTGGSYVGTWVISDNDYKFEYVEITANTFNDIQYRIENNRVTRKSHPGKIAVSGDKIVVTEGEAPFKEATYKVENNVLSVAYTYKGETEKMEMSKISAEQQAKLKGWEEAYKQQ